MTDERTIDPTEEQHREAFDALQTAIMGGDAVAVTPIEVRRAAAERTDVPERFAAYVDTIHDHAYQVSDRTVSDLRAAGASQDEVFEVTDLGGLRSRTRTPRGGSRRRARSDEGVLMRLEAVARGRGMRAKAKLTMIRLFSGAPAVDVVKTLEYRPAFFGTPFNAIIQEVMRGPSEWSVGERELFAAFVSDRNRCMF